MILNEIERAVICGTREYRTNADFIDAIEAAVIEKLCAGVSMPEAVDLANPNDEKSCYGYTSDQLRAYGAACRLKALEDCLNEIEGWANDQFELKTAIRSLKGEA